MFSHRSGALIELAAVVGLTFLTTISATAQSFYPEATYESQGSFASSVALADVNGDGKLDLLVANRCGRATECADGGVVSVLLGNGDGTFKTAVSYKSGGALAHFVTVADVNNDGYPDLVVANDCASGLDCASAWVSVLLGNGDGTFRDAVSYASGGHGFGGESLAVADVNGDGNPDLLVANVCASSSNCSTGSLGVLLGNGDGTFQTAVLSSAGPQNAQSLAIADRNGDGKPDVVVANACIHGIHCTSNSPGSVTLLLGNGDGTFRVEASYSSGGAGANSITVGDVNRDGTLDLLVANADGTVGVLLGNRNGTFRPVAVYNSGGQTAMSIVVADINGDGKPDAVVATSCGSRGQCTPDSVRILLGNGNGTFQTAVPLGGMEAQSIAVADVNGDGKPDLLVAKRIACSMCTSGSASVFINKKRTTVRAFTRTSLTTSVNPSSYGNPIMFTARVKSRTAGTLAGTVTFTVQGVGTEVPLMQGVATLTVSDLVAGHFPITAAYSGDSNFQPSTSETLNQTVNRVTTTTTFSSSPNPAIYNQLITFTIKVTSSSPITPTGVVDIWSAQAGPAFASVSLINGSATYTTSKLWARTTCCMSARYQRDAGSDKSLAFLDQVILPDQITTTMTSSLNPAPAGQPVTFTATVTASSGTPPPSPVLFLEGNTFLASVPLTNGTATFTAVFPRGNHYITVHVPHRFSPNYSGTFSQLVIEKVTKAQ